MPSLEDLEEALTSFLEGQGGRASLSAVAEALAKQFPGFKASALGCGRLSSLIQKKMGHCVEVIPSRGGLQAAAALRGPSPEAQATEAQPTLQEVEQTIVAFLQDRQGPATLTELGQRLGQLFPGFRPSALGCGKLSTLVQQKMAGRLELITGKDQPIVVLRPSAGEDHREGTARERVCLRRDLMRTLASLTPQGADADKIQALCEKALSDGTALRSGNEMVIDTGLLDRRGQPIYAWLERSGGPTSLEWDLRSFCKRGQGFYGRLMDQRFPQAPSAGKAPTPKAAEPAQEAPSNPPRATKESSVGASTEEVQQALARAPSEPQEPQEIQEPQASEAEAPNPGSPLPSLPELQATILQLIDEAPGGKMTLPNLSAALRERIPGFRPGYYGCSKMISLLTRKMDGQVTLKKDHRHDQTLVTRSPCGARTQEVQRALVPGSTVERTPALAPTLLGSFSMVQENHCRALAELALEEPWHFGEADGTFPILREYLRSVYSRLRHQKKVLLSSDRRYAALNTGLLNRTYEPIFAFFERGRQGVLQWELKDFCLAGQGLYGKLLTRHFSPLPEEPTSDLDPQDLFYDRSLGAPSMDWTHILVNRLGRIPLEALRSAGLQVPPGSRFQDPAAVRQCQDQLRESPNAYRRLKALFEAALELTMKRLQYDFHLAVPVYRASNQSLALALPLWLLEDRQADLGLIVERIDANSYMGHTVYPLDWVYSASRPLFQPSQPWLDPRKIRAFPVLAAGLQQPGAPQPQEKAARRRGQPERGIPLDPEAEAAHRSHWTPGKLLHRIFMGSQED